MEWIATVQPEARATPCPYLDCQTASNFARRITTFVEEEIQHQLIDAMFPWWDERPGLAAARPLRPAVTEVPDEDCDEVLSNIGSQPVGARREAKTGGVKGGRTLKR
jgi:hypothetical protein